MKTKNTTVPESDRNQRPGWLNELGSCRALVAQ